MILNCNSCGKKFVVPDQAIPASGRLVQCGSCGNKWKQFPANIDKPRSQISKPAIKQSVSKPKKIKQKILKKVREIDLYSPEYLEKKHGITLGSDKKKVKFSNNRPISFGFYNYLILFIVLIIVLSRGLYFFQDFLSQSLPFTKFYLDYFFESIRNMFEIWKNLISIY